MKIVDFVEKMAEGPLISQTDNSNYIKGCKAIKDNL